MNTSLHIKQLHGQVKAIFLFCDKWTRHNINLLSTVILKMKLKEMLVQVREETIRLEEQQQVNLSERAKTLGVAKRIMLGFTATELFSLLTKMISQHLTE